MPSSPKKTISFMKHFVKLIRKHLSPLVHVQTIYQCILALTDDIVFRTEGLNNRLVSVATKPLDNHLGKEDKSDSLTNELLSLIPYCLQLKLA